MEQVHLLQKAFPDPGIRHATNPGLNPKSLLSLLKNSPSGSQTPTWTCLAFLWVLFLQGDHEFLDGRTQASSFSSVPLWCLAQCQGSQGPMIIGHWLGSPITGSLISSRRYFIPPSFYRFSCSLLLYVHWVAEWTPCQQCLPRG